MSKILETSPEASTTSIAESVARVCRRIPPLWDLTNYVAVNPFLGFASRPIAEAAREISDGLGAHVLPRLDYYRERWQAEDFGPADLAQAAERAGLSSLALVEILEGRAEPTQRPSSAVSSFAEAFDRRHGTGWDDAVIRHVARWCTDHASGGGPSWKIVGDAGLYPSWKESACVDRSLEVAGLFGWRRWTMDLPARAEEAIEAMLERHRVTPEIREPYLYRLLAGRGRNLPGRGGPSGRSRVLRCRRGRAGATGRRGPFATVPPARSDSTVCRGRGRAVGHPGRHGNRLFGADSGPDSPGPGAVSGDNHVPARGSGRVLHRRPVGTVAATSGGPGPRGGNPGFCRLLWRAHGVA